MAKGKSPEDIAGNRMLLLALIHLVEMVGEAASQIPLDTQARYPGIPWSKAIGTRHRLVHGYDAVDQKVLLDTIHDDLPPLIEELKRVLPPELP
jgi:uncharacterized protein with HEPN domain